MKNVALVFCLAVFSSTAFGYQDGRHSCKNPVAGLPDNIYDIKSVATGVGAAKLPYIEVFRFFHKKPTDPNSPIVKATVRGFGTVFANEGESEMLSIGAIKLEFVNGELLGCIK